MYHCMCYIKFLELAVFRGEVAANCPTMMEQSTANAVILLDILIQTVYIFIYTVVKLKKPLLMFVFQVMQLYQLPFHNLIKTAVECSTRQKNGWGIQPYFQSSIISKIMIQLKKQIVLVIFNSRPNTLKILSLYIGNFRRYIVI